MYVVFSLICEAFSFMDPLFWKINIGSGTWNRYFRMLVLERAFQTSKPPSTPKHKRSEPTPNPNSTPERRVQLTFNDDDEGGKENLRHHVGKRVEGGKKRCVSCRRETSRRRESCGSQEGVFAEGRVLRGRGSSWRQSSWERREFGKGCKGSLVN